MSKFNFFLLAIAIWSTGCVVGEVKQPKSSPGATAVSPVGGTTAGGTTVTINGKDFKSPSVSIGGVACSVLSSSATSITCSTGANSLGVYNIVVNNSDGTSTTLSSAYEYRDDPTFVSVASSVGSTAGGGTITITGTNFSSHTGTPTVTLGGSSCSGVTYVSQTQLTCTTPASSAGTVNLVVTNPSGQSVTATNAFTYQNSPVVSSVSPASGDIAGGTTISITGANFSNLGANPTVTVGGVACTGVTYTSSSIIGCTTGAHAAGATNVVVTNNSGLTGTGLNLFTYQAAPTVTAISPVGGVTAGGTTVTITGTNFSTVGGDPTVTINATTCGSVSVTNSTTLTCSTGAQALGIYNVTVDNADDTTAGSGTSLFEHRDNPTYGSVSPTFGSVAGGTTITINGANFSNHTAVPTVTVGGAACTSVTYVNAGQLTCVTPAGTAGTADIIITNASGQTVTGSAAFTYQAAATVTSVSPASGSTGGGTTITITGTNFTNTGGNPTITVGGVACGTVTYTSSTTIGCTTGARTAGNVDVVVTNTNASPVTGSGLFTYQDAPTVTAVSPVGGRTAGGTSITVTGTNFSTVGGQPGVTINSVACTSVNVTSATSLTCLTGAVALGTYAIVVDNTDDTASGTSGAIYEYRDDPTIASITPASGTTAGGTSITISGTNFSNHTADPTVTIGGTACANIVRVNDTTITCDTPAGVSGPRDVTITNASGQFVTSTGGFTYQNVPVVSSVSPVGGATAGGTTITITGANFSTIGGQPTVTVGAVACTSVNVSSSTTLTCDTGAQAAGTYNITVDNQDDSASGSNTNLFQYLDDPTFVSATPNFGGVAGGTSITISGTNFSNHTANPTVTVGGNTCTGLIYTDANTISCTTPIGVAGLVDIVITNPSGQSITAGSAFTYQAAPVISGVTPSSGTIAGGTNIAINGNHFSNNGGVPTVTVGGVACTSVNFTDVNNIDCVTGANSAGSATIVVTNVDGQSDTETGLFTYQSTPVISSVSPVGGVTAGSTAVTLTGSNFSNIDGNPTVTIGGTACTGVNVTSSTSLTCTTGAVAAGVYSIVVDNQDDHTSGTGTNLYEYRDDPTFGTVVPNYGTTAGGTSITINGTNFSNHTADPTILIGSTACTNIAWVSATQLTCDTPAQTAGTYNITVTNASGQSVLASSVFTYQNAPTVLNVTPASGSTAGGTSVTVTGTNFSSLGGQPTVTIGGVACTGVNVTTPSTLTCTTGAGAAGAQNVFVQNSDGQSGSGTGLFTYQNAPTVVSVSPVGGVTAGGTTVTITGTNFSSIDGQPTVTIGASNCTNVNVSNATTLTCDTTAQALGTYAITVDNADDTTSGTQAGLFEYRDDPTISTISPTVGLPAGGETITIDGTNFSNHTAVPTVTIGGVTCGSVSYVGATQITCVTGVGTDDGSGVTVTNASGQTVSSTPGFYYQSVPTVTSISPNNGPASGGTTVTITGNNFSTLGVPTVTLNTIACTGVSVTDQNTLTCTTGAGAQSTGDVIVTNPDTSSSANTAGNNLWTYNGTPTITGVTPSQVAVSGGATVTINGTNFISGATVAISDSGCSTTTFVSTTEITCTTTSASSAGLKNVTVTNTDGGTVTQTNILNFLAPPTLASISPSQGGESGGTSVTVTGTNFFFIPTVTIGGVTCSTNAANPNSTTFTCDVPANTTGVKDVVLTNPDTQSATLISSFTYTSDAVFGWAPASHSYGTVSVNTTQQFTVNNTGTGSSGNLTVYRSGTDPGVFVITNDTCTGTVLAPAGSCTVDVTFLGGSISSGTYNANLNVGDDKFTTEASAAITGTR